MKKNYIADIRYCQKIKQSQSFKSVDGLQKKVRKRFKLSPTLEFDAENQLREIMCFWKAGWDYEHFHPVFLNPKVFYPIVTMSDPQQQTNPQLVKYAQIIKKLIERLRVDQQIEVNYKIQERKYISKWDKIKQIDPKWKYFKVASLSNQDLFKCLNAATEGMCQSVEDSLKQIESLYEVLDSEEIYKLEEIQKQLMFLSLIFKNHHQVGHNQMQQESKENFQSERQHLNAFVANVVSIMEDMKEENHGPSLISVQPKIGQLTYVLHPVLWSIYSLFYKQQVNIQKINQFKRDFEQQSQCMQKQITNLKEMDEIELQKRTKEAKIWQSLPLRQQNYLLDIKDNFRRQNEAHSKVVFLNLDGYESEYNLQVARNFYQNLMYISFPKFSTSNQKKVSAYEERFYNKIMFEKTRLSEEMSQNQELDYIYKQERITKSPQEYHEHVQKLYKENNYKDKVIDKENESKDKSEKEDEQFMEMIDRNEKIFIFPVRMNCLVEKHRESFPQTHQVIRQKGYRMEVEEMSKEAAHEAQKLCDLVQNYESYFIRLVMRKYLYGQIQKFKPTHIIISYSNRIIIEDSHFVQMMQELTNLGRYKLMFFPNFTTSFVDEIKLQAKQKDPQQEKNELDIETTNCYAVSNARLVINSPNAYMDSMALKGFDNCPLTLSFFGKIMRFLKISSGTYNLQQNYQYQPFALKLKNVKIHPYAQFLFNILSEQYSHLSNKIDKDILRADKYFLQQRLRQEKQQLKKCVPGFYKQLFHVLQKLVIHGIYGEYPIEQISSRQQQKQGHPISPYTIDVRRIFQLWTNITDKQGMKRIRNHHIQSIKQPFDEFINSEQKQKMDSKYQVNNHLFFKTRLQTVEYGNAAEATINLKANNLGLRIVTFKLDKDKVLFIYKDTSIVFQTNQIDRSQAFVLVMNHLGLHDQVVNHYIGKVKLDKKPSFSHQSCIVEPIQFFDGNQPLQSQKFKAKCQWNYKQTQHYLVLYWPSEYDFIKANLLKMIKQHYEPRICHDIFIAKKTSYNKFYKVRINLDVSAASILPRRGCSAYDFDSKLFIFGGVYEREFNYLNQQNDIVTIDLKQLSPNSCQSIKQCEKKMSEISIDQRYKAIENVSLQTCQLTLKNLKGQLYSQQYVQSITRDTSQGKKLNSFIRPKIQVEFYDANDICNGDVQASLNQENTHTVIMIGGYGENFMFPHSLLTYFYHILRFDSKTRELKNIEKRNTIEKPIPINLKELVKNKNIFQHFQIFQNDTITQGLTRQTHYFYHRVAYQLSKVDKKIEVDSVSVDLYDLNYKFLFLYAAELYNDMDKNYVRFAQKIGEKRVIQESQGTRVEIVNGCNNNLFITNEDGTFLYSLNYKQSVTSLEIIPLINEAIISLDVSNNITCALIKHKDHTKDKCVLASERIEMPNPKFAFQNNSHYVNLIKFIEFQHNYELHVLFMMKRNELIIVHGVSFEEYDVHDKVISTKYTKAEGLGQILEEKSPIIKTPSVSLKQFYQCTSFLARQNQKLFSINLMSHQSKQQDFIYCFQKYSLDMNSKNKQWKQQGGRKYVSFYFMDGSNQVYLRKIQFLETRQNNKSKLTNSSCIIVPSTPISLSQTQFSFSIQRIDTEPSFVFNSRSIHKVRVYEVPEKQVWSKISWKRIYKNHQRYEDCGLKLNNKMEEA